MYPSSSRFKRRGAIESASATSSGFTSNSGCVRSMLESRVRSDGATDIGSVLVRIVSVVPAILRVGVIDEQFRLSRRAQL